MILIQLSRSGSLPGSNLQVRQAELPMISSQVDQTVPVEAACFHETVEFNGVRSNLMPLNEHGQGQALTDPATQTQTRRPLTVHTDSQSGSLGQGCAGHSSGQQPPPRGTVRYDGTVTGRSAAPSSGAGVRRDAAPAAEHGNAA
eukprot:768316-Hanusia_phi.AAC.2